MRFSGRGGEICRHPFSCHPLPPRRRCNDPCRRAAFGRTVITYIACMGAVQPPYRLDMSSKRPCWHAGYRSAILSPGIFIFPLIGRVHYHFAAVGRKERYSELIGAHLFRYTQEIHTSEGNSSAPQKHQYNHLLPLFLSSTSRIRSIYPNACKSDNRHHIYFDILPASTSDPIPSREQDRNIYHGPTLVAPRY